MGTCPRCRKTIHHNGNHQKIEGVVVHKVCPTSTPLRKQRWRKKLS